MTAIEDDLARVLDDHAMCRAMLVDDAWVYGCDQKPVTQGGRAAHLAAVLAPIVAKHVAAGQERAWDEGFTRGFYDPLAGGSRDASESAVEFIHYHAATYTTTEGNES